VLTHMPNRLTAGEQYDQLGRLAAQTTPDGGSVAYAYDQLGRRRYRLDPDGVARYWRYDPLDRLTSGGYLQGTQDIETLRSLALSADGTSSEETWLTAVSYDIPVDGPGVGALCRPVQVLTRHSQGDITPAPVSETYTYDVCGRLASHSISADSCRRARPATPTRPRMS
jgi:YD repeat-containing protein